MAAIKINQSIIQCTKVLLQGRKSCLTWSCRNSSTQPPLNRLLTNISPASWPTFSAGLPANQFRQMMQNSNKLYVVYIFKMYKWNLVCTLTKLTSPSLFLEQIVLQYLKQSLDILNNCDQHPLLTYLSFQVQILLADNLCLSLQ